ncbi:MAG: hypothetical protein E5X33_26005 [Mesorhizobium sp.]|nr:MAG: hypothetical protein EOR22_30565 [Mesorhizobium sp.]TIQ03964.1 MAG: hypothetical protein E5X50_26950 [Mesorhizobium sp.]TIR17541.1 MAG: hypothetical protein E5X33_26005 [Mesorhizobium sp.]
MLVDVVNGRVEKLLHKDRQPYVSRRPQPIYEYREIKLRGTVFSSPHLQHERTGHFMERKSSEGPFKGVAKEPDGRDTKNS